jgi:phosphoribosyl-ATP pyrophosphohydrolase
VVVADEEVALAADEEVEVEGADFEEADLWYFLMDVLW